MGKHKKGSKIKQSGGGGTGGVGKAHQKDKTCSAQQEDDNAVVTMEALRAMSDSDSEGELPPEDEWNEEARSLKNAIEKGVFNKLLRNVTAQGNSEDDDESFEEVVLDDDDSEDDESDELRMINDNQAERRRSTEESHLDGDEDENSQDDDEDEDSDEYTKKNINEAKDGAFDQKSTSAEQEDEIEENDDDKEEDDECDEDDEAEADNDAGEEQKQMQKQRNLKYDAEGLDGLKPKDDEDEDECAEEEVEDQDDGDAVGEGHLSTTELNARHRKALRIAADEILTAQTQLSWPETFDVVSTAPLPFDSQNEHEKVDIHDDLKREVAFYDFALQAAVEGRQRCEQADIPFARPDDFFGEMVKSDDHMARIKDRLIFENKKIDAVNQRKANKEQKLRSRELHANKLAEKARRKKDNLQTVDDWARDAASKRNGGQLSNEYGGGRDSPNKKRMAANKKYGFGGKKGRFKQTDRKALNDMSGFNARGNFQGGQKRKAGAGGDAKAGQKRPGKRAREASRSRQK